MFLAAMIVAIALLLFREPCRNRFPLFGTGTFDYEPALQRRPWKTEWG